MDKYTIEDLDLYYGDFKALKGINLNISEKEITAFIGPSGCGKSTPVSYTHLLPEIFGVTGVWLAVPVAELVTMVVALMLIYRNNAKNPVSL